MKTILENEISAIVTNLYDQTLKSELARPNIEFGDYATNIAMQLAKSVGKNPRAIAESIAEKVSELPAVASVDIAGPGFLNIRLTEPALWQSAQRLPAQTLQGKTVLVEYSDPNPFKPLHAGHLYTTLVGDSIARLVQRAGAKTIRINYGGDVGLHVARSMWGIIQFLGGENPEKLSSIPEDERAIWMGARYVEGTRAYEEDEEAKAAIILHNKRVYTIHSENDHDSPYAQIYWTCREWSYSYFRRLYRELDVVPFDRFIPESEVTALGVATVQEQLQKGVFTESDGAVVYRGDESKGLHTRVFINSSGIPTYETKDVGLSLTKWQDYTFDDSIIITANEQAQYMQVVLSAISAFAPEPAARTIHITHGTVKMSGGVKMSSRKGNIVSALDIIQAARDAGAASGTNPSEKTTLAAIKYSFAKARIGGDIIYDPTESIALEGNSGPYLQYAHARAQSILAKLATGTDTTEPQNEELTPSERELLGKLGEYAEVVEKATFELLPHSICTYLYELAQTFNRFYEQNRVIGDPRQALRALLVKNYAATLKAGLELLGIEAPDTM